VAFKPSLKRKHTPESEDLDITPIMNLVVVLIPLLLATAEFVKLGLLETQLPPEGASAGGGGAPEQQEQVDRLSLLVSVDSLGFAVSIFGSTSESERADEFYRRIPRLADAGLDFSTLNAEMLRIRRDFVIPAITGKVQNTDNKGRELYNPDGTPQMVDEYRFEDAERVMISAPNDLPFQELVTVMDNTRVYADPETGAREMLFPSPIMAKIQ